MKRLLSYFKPDRFLFALMLVIKTVGSAMDLVIPLILQHILDNVAPICKEKGTLAPVFQWGAAMLLCSAAAYFGSVVANRLSAKLARNVVRRIRSDLFRKVLSLSQAQVDAFTVPSLVSRLSSDTYFIHDMLLQFMRAGLRNPILLIGGIVITLSIEPALSLSFLSALPVLSLVVWIISHQGVRLYREKQKKTDRMVEVVRDNFTGIRVIKALSRTEREKKRFAEANRDLSRAEEKAGVKMATSRPIINVFLNWGMTAVILLGAWRITGGSATPGQIISFMQYFTIILNATLIITRLFTVISKGIASAQRIDEILSSPEDLAVEKTGETSDAFVEFRDVTFTYNSKALPTLSHLSFKLNEGESLGVIGSTGSGKSTLAKLLMRFYDADEGAVFVGGKNVKDIPKEILHSLFGAALQNDFLMADTLEENVRFSREIGEEQIRRGAKIAQASFIDELEDGFGYELTAKGQNLSGGQRQRVLIARAIAASPAILILDDSSSALDYKTDARLRRDLRENAGGSTVIVVAQRVSSVKDCTKVLVLEHGEAIGFGTHEELMKSCPIYQEIAHSQMGDLNS